ncbi:MAG: hypothetical protein NC311_19730, partial [Muribaculaceae bacterium]|nr:hypothetical protein [Muribaculaceae bacterium]
VVAWGNNDKGQLGVRTETVTETWIDFNEDGVKDADEVTTSETVIYPETIVVGTKDITAVTETASTHTVVVEPENEDEEPVELTYNKVTTVTTHSVNTFNNSHEKDGETINSVAVQTAVGQSGYVLYAADTAVDGAHGQEGETKVDTYKTVYAAGDNTYGQIGVNKPYRDVSYAPEARQVLAGDANPKAMLDPIDSIMYIATSAYGGTAAAYDNNYGTVYGWGNNVSGQIGDGTYANRVLPTMTTMDGGGSYLDISHVLLNPGDTMATPKYTANVAIIGYTSTSTARVYRTDATTDQVEAASASFSDEAGTGVRVELMMANDAVFASAVLIHSTGVVEALPSSVVGGNMVFDFLMPNENVTIHLNLRDTTGYNAQTHTARVDTANSAAGTVYTLYRDGNLTPVEGTTSINNALPGEKLCLAIVPEDGKVVTGVYMTDSTGYHQIAFDAATGIASFIQPEENVTLTVVCGDTRQPYMGTLMVVDNYNTTSTPNTVQVQVGNGALSAVASRNNFLTFNAHAGDVVTVTANTVSQAYYVEVSVQSANYWGVYSVPVVSGLNTAQFVMPTDAANVTVAFKYGSTSEMIYDTLITPDGTLMTSLIYDDRLQIIAADIVAYLGFNAYGPFSYTPDLEDLTFESTNPEVATVDATGLIVAQHKAGYSYIIVTDDRGNQGFFKVQVSPTPDVEDTRTIAFPVIAVGASHTIALKADGSVWAWGDNSYGQLGVPRGTTQATTPTEVLIHDAAADADIPLTGIVKVAAGGNHNLALAADGTMYAWGDNATGALGQGPDAGTGIFYTAVKVKGVTDGGYLGADANSSIIVDIAASGLTRKSDSSTERSYSFAMDRNGRVFGWGLNYHGVVDPTAASGGNAAMITLPVQISGEGKVSALSNALTLSSDKIAADMRLLKKDGQIYSWGQNDANHPAYGGYNTDRESPDRAVLGGRALEVSGGVFNAVAVTTAGEVKTWGGDNSVKYELVPEDTTNGIPAHYKVSEGYETRYANGIHNVVIYSGEQLMDKYGNMLTEEKEVQTLNENNRPLYYQVQVDEDNQPVMVDGQYI